jgi:putative transposase
MLKAIHAQESRQAAEAKAAAVVAELGRMKLSKLAEWITTSVVETPAYLAFPSEHWRRIRTNNPLERIMREIRRRTRVVGAFPDGESALNLAAARLRHVAGSQWSTRRYLNMDLLKEQRLQCTSKNLGLAPRSASVPRFLG